MYLTSDVCNSSVCDSFLTDEVNVIEINVEDWKRLGDPVFAEPF